MTILRLHSLDDPRLDPYAHMTQRQLRNRLDPAQAVIIAESALVIDVALRSGVQPLSILLEERQLTTCDAILGRLPDDVPVFVLPAEQLSRLAGFRVTRGPFAAMRRPRQPSPAEVVHGAQRLAVLEGLVDVSNVGAVFRSAAALGVDGILVAPTCADPLNRRAIRVSMGTVFQVPWARADDSWPQATFDLLRSARFHSVAMALEPDALALDDPRLKTHERLALFFGAERSGLSRAVLERSDAKAIIPMAHGVDSLNVAASSAVVFWELCRKGARGCES